MHRARGWAVVAVLAIWACSTGRSRFELRHPAHKDYAIGVAGQTFDISNGIEVVLLYDHHVDVVEVDVRYQVGSREDPPDKPGLAHLVEHLMFEQRAGGPDRPSIGARLREQALMVNATTDFDATHFMAQARKERFEQLLQIEAERMTVGCRSITPEVVDREREVVRNELREKRNILDENALLAALYPPGHPYAHSPGGSIEGLGAITLADVCSFVDRYYTSDRAIVVIAGDLDADRVSEALDPLTRVAPRKGAPRALVPAVAPRAASLGLLEAAGQIDSIVHVAAWPIAPTYSDAGGLVPYTLAFGLDALDAIQVTGGAEAPFAVIALTDGDPDKLFSQVETRVYMKTDGRLDEERPVWKLGLLSRLEALPRRTAFVADEVQFRGVAGADLGAELRRIDDAHLATLKPEVEKRLGRKTVTWITVRPRVGGLAPPAAALVKSPADDVLSVDEREAASTVDVPADAMKLAAARRFVLDNGLAVVLLPYASNLPMVTARLTFRGGMADEPKGLDGLASMTAYSLGAQAASENLLRYGFEDSREIDTERTTFQMHGLGVNLDPMLATLGALVEEGSCVVQNNRPTDYFGLKRSERLRRELAGPRARAERAEARILLAAVYGADHPYARAGALDADSLMRIDNRDVNGFRKKHYVGRRGTLVVTGTFDLMEAEQWVREYLGGFPAGSPAAPPPPLGVHGGALGLVGPAGASLPVVLAWTVAADDARFAARLVAARMLERRMRAVRERQGASYGVMVKLETLSAGVVYRATANLDPARAGAAIRLMREQADGLARGEHLAADFVGARRDVIEELLGHSSSSLDRAAELDWLGARPPELIAALVRSVATLTVADLQPVLADDLAPARQALVVVGSLPLLVKTFEDAGVKGARLVEAR